ncbi:MAG: DUF932 domain-containing protein [Blastocatellia bacterium]
MNQLATSFSSRANVLRFDRPLTIREIDSVAPSIFAEGPHESRSSRYTYIPTGVVLEGLRKEGFEPFMVCQARTRDETRRDFTKHMIRLRHASQIAGAEVNEIILVNSHDGTSSYQMLAGVFRFVCHNGLVCGDVVEDLRIPHRGNPVGEVIEGAYRILDDFERVDAARQEMKAVILTPDEQTAFAKAALALRYEGEAPVSAYQVLRPRRADDAGQDLWSTFNVVQERLIRGGQRGTNRTGKRITTRPVTGIDNNVRLNRALWVLAGEMAELKQAA